MLMNDRIKRTISAILALLILSGCTNNTSDVHDNNETVTELDTKAIVESENDITETADTTETSGEEDADISVAEVRVNTLSKDDYQTDLQEYAEKLLEKIRAELTNERVGIAYEYLGSKQISFLWPFSVLLESVSALYECDTTNEELKEYYTLLLDKFLPRYEGTAANVKKVYSSTTGDGDKYYDDNEWIVIELVRASKLLGNSEYLESAKELAEFCYSGWVDSSGGIKWKMDGDSCNTCSNGPAAVFSCMLYEETGDQYYLDWAEKIYSWTYEKLCDSDGTYFDSIKIKNGSVDESKYSYNTGTMLVSGVMLYRITGNDEYLTQARQSAEGGVNEFFIKAGKRCVVKNSHPWFNSWLLEGYIELYKTDITNEQTKEYINDFYSVLETAVKRAGDDLYVGKSWNSKADDEVELIHQAGTVRAMAQLANLINNFAE